MKLDRRFVDELIAQAQKLTQRECEYMGNVGIRKELAGKYDTKTIEMLEHIYWTVAAGKGAAA